MNPLRNPWKTLVTWCKWRSRQRAINEIEDYRSVKLQLILDAMKNEPELQRPYVIGGTYRWLNISGPVKLDLFFPDVVVAFKIGHCYSMPYPSVKKHVPYDIWHNLSSEDARAKNACRECRIPLVFIAPGDPIDKESIRAMMDRAIEKA